MAVFPAPRDPTLLNIPAELRALLIFKEGLLQYTPDNQLSRQLMWRVPLQCFFLIYRYTFSSWWNKLQKFLITLTQEVLLRWPTSFFISCNPKFWRKVYPRFLKERNSEQNKINKHFKCKRKYLTKTCYLIKTNILDLDFALNYIWVRHWWQPTPQRVWECGVMQKVNRILINI